MNTARLLALACWFTLPNLSGAAEAIFDFEGLRHRAQLLAARPYAPLPANQVPDWLRKLNYDEFRLIEFEAEHALWRRDGLGFQAQFFHPGNLYNTIVPISEVRDKHAEPIAFRREFFNYNTLKVGPLPDTMGFAGLRLIYPLNPPREELGSFLGTSYFRFLCQNAFYGLSARGLALNTAEPSGEEFPLFTEFWIERPAANAKSVAVFALLDSPSMTGAYRFVITPGADTVLQVRATLRARNAVKVLGVAPLTSMFWRGENGNVRADDFRPEIHDSDGLLMNTGTGEWLWRPLRNPSGVSVVAFSDDNPRGFGLLQRDRDFDHYQDLEAHYQLRPSAWVEPVGHWGRGTIRLVELPTTDEYRDNIVAFWTPEKVPPPGEPIELDYRLHWFLDQIRPPAGCAIATRQRRADGTELFLVDFAGGDLNKLAADAPVQPVAEARPAGKLVHTTVQKNPYNGSWRVTLTVQPDGSGKPVELRCFLRRASDVLTETWTYLWQP